MTAILSKLNVFTLFIHVFSINALTFGGGYVIVPLLKRRFAEKLGWITEDAAADIIAAAQASPGAIAVNASLLLGLKCCGKKGAAAAVIAAVLPPFIIISLIYGLYENIIANETVLRFFAGAGIGVAAVIANAAAGIIRQAVKKKPPFAWVCAAAVFVLVFFFNINVIYVIAACFITGALRGYLHTGE